MVTHPAALERRGVAGSAQQIRQPGAGPEGGDVIGGTVGLGAGLP